jgi:hypothetical protein
VAGEDDDDHIVFLRRCHEALEAGLSVKDATAFAHSDRDIGELRKCVEHECPPELIRRIVL